MMRRLMGASPAIEKLRETILDVAQADGHVLILGETGTGKSLIATAMHAGGPRAAKPLVDGELRQRRRPSSSSRCCSAGPTGRRSRWSTRPTAARSASRTSRRCRRRRRRGCSRRSTPPTRTGARRASTTSASSRCRAASVQGAPQELLRDDLYFRLAGLVIEAPPLRARGEDILTLFSHFTIQFAEEYGCEPPTLERRRRREPGAGALARQHPPAHQPRRARGAAGPPRRPQHLGAADRRRLPGAGDARSTPRSR